MCHPAAAVRVNLDTMCHLAAAVRENHDTMFHLAAAAVRVLGSSKYPRPCSGFSGIEQQICFCHYHQGAGTYVWPFSTTIAKKCRQAVECKPPNPKLKDCPATTVADDVEFNGETRCLLEPSGFECSTGGAPGLDI
jgi:hypothetical protein